VLTLADGTTRRQEFYYGSTYLSQSSRFLKVPDEVTKVTVYDYHGRGRALDGKTVSGKR
jgi:enediyne biosynthesis protein E4